jgi:hypothetical protein
MECTIIPFAETTANEQLYNSSRQATEQSMASADSFLGLLVLVVALASGASAQLSSTFYDTSCPNALSTIRTAVNAAVAQEPRMGAYVPAQAALPRLLCPSKSNNMHYFSQSLHCQLFLNFTMDHPKMFLVS